VKLVVGLGNPGKSHKGDRHNVGFSLLERLCLNRKVELRENPKHKAMVGADANGIRFLKPLTYMNLSGLSVKSISQYYNISPELILVFHDELDLPAGEIKLKRGGGTGGHNGLRSVEEHLSSKDYCRVRVGIGRPEGRQSVTSYVLSTPSRDDGRVIESGMERVLAHAEDLLSGYFDRAMNFLNQRSSLENL